MTQELFMKRMMIAILMVVTGAPLLAQSAIELKDTGKVTEYTEAKTGPNAKIGLALTELMEAQTNRRAINPDNPLFNTSGSNIVIDAIAAGDTADLKAALAALGMQQMVAQGRVISGLLPIDALDDLAQTDALAYARPAAFKTNAGLVSTRGDEAMGSDIARATFGVDGTGIMVGVMSDSFDCAGTETAVDIANGDLPPNVLNLDDSGCPATDEARGMAQIIHDLAPGADIAYHTANGGQANFATGILELAAAGCDIIVDDVSYFAEPYFQDGIIAQAVDEVVKDRVAYFSAAGNDADHSYESRWRDSGVIGLGGGVLHDFDPGPGVDATQTLLIPTGYTLFGFQWDDPFFSVSGAPGAAADLDIYIVGDGAVQGVGGAANIGLDPYEQFLVFNPGAPVEWELMIELFEGTAPRRIKYIYYEFGGELSISEYATASSTVVGHPNAAGACAIGAAAWFNTPFWNTFVTEAVINSYSSLGGTTILRKDNGNRTFRPRFQPRLVAPDGVNTTFFGGDLSFNVPGTTEPDGFPNFFGTSAAAPHAAGIAALVLDAYDNGPFGHFRKPLKPSRLYRWMQWTADDMDDPATVDFDTGFDFRTGFGFIDAFAAVQRATWPFHGSEDDEGDD
jgi:hypothetical protein